MQKNTLALLIWTFSGFQQTFAQNFNKQKLDSLFDGLSTYNKSMGTVLIARNEPLRKTNFNLARPALLWNFFLTKMKWYYFKVEAAIHLPGKNKYFIPI